MIKHLADDFVSQRPWMRDVIVYLIVILSVGLQINMMFVVPLWALYLNATPFQVGLAVSAFSILPIFYSLSFGTLIDRFGPRKIMLINSVAAFILVILYPIFPNIWCLVVLQLLLGQAIATLWIGAQSYVLILSNQFEKSSYASNFSFAAHFGIFVGPLLMGTVWDISGPIFTFVFLGFWTLCLFGCSFFIVSSIETYKKEDSHIIGWKEFVPKWKEYKNALLLLLIPAVVVTIYATFMRLSAFSMRSLFMVYLERLSFSATAISVLFSMLAITAMFSSLIMQKLLTWINHKKLLIIGCAGCIIPMSLPPLFTNYWALLSLTMTTGFASGIVLYMMMSIISDNVPEKNQAEVVSLREMGNRFSATIIPVAFGFFANVFGLSTSFFIIGGLLVLSMFIIFPLLLNRYT